MIRTDHAMPLRRHLLAGAAFLAALPAQVHKAGAQVVKVRLGTATPGGGFPVYGAAFVEAVRRVDPGLEIEPVNTKGSTENVPMLEAGTLDIALVQGEVVHESLSGIGRPPADLKIITAMYPTAGMFVVRADSSYRRIADLLGKPIAWGAQGSGLVILGRYAMDGLGFDAAKDFQPIYLERAGDGPAMVLDGRAAALWGGGASWPGFTTVARSEGVSSWHDPASTMPWPGVSPRRCTRWKKPAVRRRNWSTPRRRTRWLLHRASACIQVSHAISRRQASIRARNLASLEAFLGLATKEHSMDDKQKKDSKIEGEGSYSGTRAYNESTAKFLKKGKVDEAAREAKRALDSKEGAELKAAEAKGKAGDPKNWEKNPSRPK